MKADVLFICVNYHCEKDTLYCVKELLSQLEDIRLDVVIADNNEPGVSSRFLENLENAYDNVRVYNFGRNLGYYGAAAKALETYLVGAEMPEWVIVSNADVHFGGEPFLSDLMEAYGEDAPEVLAPMVISELTGVNQNPFMSERPPAWKMHGYRLIFRFKATFYSYMFMHRLKMEWLARKKLTAKADRMRPISRSIYAPHGSMVVFNRKYFEKGGNFNHGAFLFNEEIFVAETARKLGLQILYAPQITIHHKEHATTGLNEVIRKYKYEAVSYCDAEFFSKGKKQHESGR